MCAGGVSVCPSILAKLCVVYSTMRLSSFKKTMDILPWNEVEKTAAAASKTGLVRDFALGAFK